MFAMPEPTSFRSIVVRSLDGSTADQRFEVNGDGRRVSDTIEGEQLVIRRHTFTMPYGIWSQVPVARFPASAFEVVERRG